MASSSKHNAEKIASAKKFKYDIFDEITSFIIVPILDNLRYECIIPYQEGNDKKIKCGKVKIFPKNDNLINNGAISNLKKTRISMMCIIETSNNISTTQFKLDNRGKGYNNKSDAIFRIGNTQVEIGSNGNLLMIGLWNNSSFLEVIEEEDE